MGVLLSRTLSGEADAERAASEAIYGELHRIAERLMAHERGDHTLQPTALVNEAYVRLAGGEGATPECRDQFLALAARVMRHILVDHARGKKRLKRGGDAARVSLNAAEGDAAGEMTPGEILAVHEVLAKLEVLDTRKARLVEMRFFGGLGEEDAARVLGISRATASSDWRFARAWLARELGASGDPGGGAARAWGGTPG